LTTVNRQCLDTVAVNGVSANRSLQLASRLYAPTVSLHHPRDLPRACVSRSSFQPESP
jgi:hypothetical protein